MKFVNCCAKEFIKIMEDKNIICFGASKYINTFSKKLSSFEWMKNICCFVDNNENLQGKNVTYNGRSWKVNSPDYLMRSQNNIVVIATGGRNTVLEIVEQLQNMKLSDEIECYALCLVESTRAYDNTAWNTYQLDKSYSIDKVIHCCWFSGEAKPVKYQECIESWKKYCPDYEIKEWNSENYDIAKNKYMKQAYDKKMWAYVSDYARLDLVYQYGGIYFDMDVEILKNIDEILKYKGFFSFDKVGNIDLGSGFGAGKRQNFIKELLDVYDDIEFVHEEGRINFEKTIPQPSRLFPVFESWGYKKNEKLQIIDDIVIFSPDYFRTIADFQHEERDFGGNEYAIHWQHAGWFDKQTLREREANIAMANKVRKIFNA